MCCGATVSDYPQPLVCDGFRVGVACGRPPSWGLEGGRVNVDGGGRCGVVSLRVADGVVAVAAGCNQVRLVVAYGVAFAEDVVCLGGVAGAAGELELAGVAVAVEDVGPSAAPFAGAATTGPWHGLALSVLGSTTVTSRGSIITRSPPDDLTRPRPW